MDQHNAFSPIPFDAHTATGRELDREIGRLEALAAQARREAQALRSLRHFMPGAPRLARLKLEASR